MLKNDNRIVSVVIAVASVFLFFSHSWGAVSLSKMACIGVD